MKTNESLKNIFPDSSNNFSNVNQPCACLSITLLELTDINGTGKGQKHHKHIGVFWADHHCVITTLHVYRRVTASSWQLHNSGTSTVPEILQHFSSRVTYSSFLFRWILWTYCSVCHSSTLSSLFCLHLGQERLPLLNQLWGAYVHYLHSRHFPSYACFCFLNGIFLIGAFK